MPSTLPAEARPASRTPPPSTLEEVMARRHLPALDGLRWIAVLVVMIYHFGWTAVPEGATQLVNFTALGTQLMGLVGMADATTITDPMFDRRRGALVGLAVGDALGAAVEFKPPGSRHICETAWLSSTTSTDSPPAWQAGSSAHGLRGIVKPPGR